MLSKQNCAQFYNAFISTCHRRLNGGPQLGELIANIPTPTISSICENISVNAVATYYLSVAKNENIKVDAKLAIPTNCGDIANSDLCIIVENLLENAIEACRYLNVETRFIKLRSRLQYNTLTITVDNSFDGTLQIKNDAYISRERGNHGIGLSSIQEVAKRYGGSAKFENKDGVFLSSVYIKI